MQGGEWCGQWLIGRVRDGTTGLSGYELTPGRVRLRDEGAGLGIQL
jgi:hypothetical protein